MTSRNQVIHSITLSLLLFGHSCWSLWIPTAATATDTFKFHRNHPLLDNNNELSNANEIEQQHPPQYMPRSQYREGIGPWPVATQQQVLRFLQDNAVEQRVHAVSANLRNLLKENSDEDLPIVYEEEDVVEEGRRGDGEGEDEEHLDENVDNSERRPGQDLQGNGVGLNNDNVDGEIIEYEINEDGEVQLNKDKRSGRYYRRYPFKRRNNRYYETPKHNCKPSREEVVKLLIALHKYQNGNKEHKNVRFCKRERPLGNIITNMRFLG